MALTQTFPMPRPHDVRTEADVPDATTPDAGHDAAPPDAH
jgi:hypothetical protein